MSTWRRNCVSYLNTENRWISDEQHNYYLQLVNMQDVYDYLHLNIVRHWPVCKKPKNHSVGFSISSLQTDGQTILF